MIKGTVAADVRVTIPAVLEEVNKVTDMTDVVAILQD
jgi:hypothetical protein